MYIIIRSERKYMRLEVKNIGKISHAEIDMQGMTVLVGNNSTGKSTISKSLYVIIQGFHNFNKKINDRRRDYLVRELAKWLRPCVSELKSLYNKCNKDAKVALRDYIDLLERFSETYDYSLKKFDVGKEDINYYIWMDSKEIFASKVAETFRLTELTEVLKEINAELIIQKRMQEIDKLYFNIIESTEEKKIAREVLNIIVQKCFSNHFSTQFNDAATEIKLLTEDSDLEHFARIYRKKGSEIVTDFSYMDFEENIVYIQPIHVLDDAESIYYRSDESGGNIHSQLFAQLMKEESKSIIEDTEKVRILKKKIGQILSYSDDEFDNEPIGEALQEDLPFLSRSFIYKDEQLKDEVTFKNVASGIKNIAIIKRLIGNSVLHQNSLLIFDEPEVNLHPDWQMKLAEILVMLRKELQIQVLINTHSPYFMRAIECYCDVYGIFDELNVYRTVKDNTTEFQYTVENVSEQENGIEYLYYQMSRPFDKLQEMIEQRRAEEEKDDE